MGKKSIVSAVSELMKKEGFDLATASSIRTSVDIIARKSGEIFAIRVMRNIDAANMQLVEKLKEIAAFIGAKPVILGFISQNGALKPNITYRRFSIDCMHVSSIEQIGDRTTSYFASKSVGVKVLIDGTRIKALRRLKAMTDKELAHEAGISQSTLYKHEKGYSYASLAVAKALEAALGASVVTSGDVNTGNEKIKIRTKKLANTGLAAIELNNDPFGMLAKGRQKYQIGLDADMRSMEKRAIFYKEVEELIPDAYAFFISNRKKGNIKGVPVLQKHNIENMKSEEELLAAL